MESTRFFSTSVLGVCVLHRGGMGIPFMTLHVGLDRSTWGGPVWWEQNKMQRKMKKKKKKTSEIFVHKCLKHCSNIFTALPLRTYRVHLIPEIHS